MIPGQMPIRVVYLLEVIEVEHDDTDGGAGACCDFIFAMQEIENCSPISGSRKAILCCLHLECMPGFQLFVLEGQDSSSGAQPGAQFLPVEGLGEVVVRTGLQPPDQILFVILGRYQQDVLIRGAVPFPNQATQVNAVQAGHDPVEDQQMGWAYLLQDLPCLCAVF